MNWSIENWYVVVGIIAILVVAGFAIYKFTGLPTKEQIIKIKAWLLQAVVSAEKDLGSGTGRIKLSVVYNAFITKFPITAKIISFETFSNLVDGALDELKELLKTNDKVKELIEKIDTIYDNLPFYMKLGICVDNQKRKIYDNGCSIKGETATEKAGAGLTVNGILYCDEFALIDPQVLKIFYQTIFPTMSSSKTAKMIITSTARGRNLFWQLYTDGLLGKNYFNPIRVDWFDVEGRDDKWKQEETANIGSEEAFEQEYGNSFDTNQQLLLPSDVMKSLKSYQSHFTNNRLSNAS